MSWKMQPPIWKSTLPPSMKLLCLALADYADDKGGSIFPSARRLHVKTGLDERTVHRLKRALINAGILEIVEYGGIAGSTRTNNYRLHLDELPEQGDSMPLPEVPLHPSKRTRLFDGEQEIELDTGGVVSQGQGVTGGVVSQGQGVTGDTVPPTGGEVSHDPIIGSDHLAPSARPTEGDIYTSPTPSMPNTPSTPIPPIPVASVIPIQGVSAIQQHTPLQDGIADKDRLAVRDHIPEFRGLPFRLLWRMRGHTGSMGDGTNTLDTALRNYLRLGHTFAEAAGHFAETEHLKPEALIRRLQSGYSHPMSPEEREQARRTWGTRKGTL